MENEVVGFLHKIGVVTMRAVGRYVGVPQSTKRTKGDLTELILGVLSGEIKPVPKSKRGAPVKEELVNPQILAGLEELNFKKAAIEADYAGHEENGGISFAEEESPVTVILHAKNQEVPYFERAIFCGEMSKLGTIDCVNIIEPHELMGEKAVIPAKLVEASGLRTGDKITFHARKISGYYMACEVLSVNAVLPGTLLENFDRAPAEYPSEKLLAFEVDESPLLKYFLSLFPVAKGQRVLISGAPKSGKSTLLREAARAAERADAEAKIVIALCEQSPESLGEWQREFQSAEIYASGYHDEPDEQVSQATKALKCAKEHVCNGESAVLFVDDLNALARAYNETEDSAGGHVLGGGLESKTVYYMKRFLGSARKLVSGASLTILGVLASDTGTPFDSALSAELLGVSTATWQLAGNFRRGKKVMPDYAASHVDNLDKFLSGEELRTLERLYNSGAEHAFEEGKFETIKESRTAHELLTRLLLK